MENLSDMLTLALEIEGLVRLLQERDDADAHDLLLSKIDKLSVLAYGMPFEDIPSNFSLPLADPEPLEELQEPEAKISEQEADLEFKNFGQTEDIQEIEGKEEAIILEESPKVPLQEIAIEMAAPSINDNQNIDIERLDDVLARENTRNFSQAFSVNDKFRFARELFFGDTEIFKITVDKVNSMKSLDEAYDYFLNDLGWDADQEAVSDFLSLVAAHFNSAQ